MTAAFAASKGPGPLPQGGFTPPEEDPSRGAPAKGTFAGRQVRLPISELKAYLAEKLAF
jgi:hypothetical protein